MNIQSSLKETHELFPHLNLTFSVVVNSLSILTIEDLINFGKSLNVNCYILREVWDFLDPGETIRNKDYKKWIKNLTLKPGEFSNLQSSLSKHSEFSKIQFFPAIAQESAKEIQLKSL